MECQLRGPVGEPQCLLGRGIEGRRPLFLMEIQASARSRELKSPSVVISISGNGEITKESGRLSFQTPRSLLS